MFRLAVIFMVAAVALAGCLGPSTDEHSNGGRNENALEGTSVLLDLNATGCDAVAVAALVEPNQAYQSLPPGFQPRDAKYLFNTSASTGKIPVFIAGLDCDSGNDALGQDSFRYTLAGVFIESPQLEGHQSTSNYEFYLVHAYTDNEVMLLALSDLGWSHDEAELEIELNPPTSLANASGTAVLTDEHGELALLRAATPTTIPEETGAAYEDWTIKFWHQTNEGLGYLDYVFTSDAQLGAGTCDLRAGSPLEQAIGQGDCPSGIRNNIENDEIPPEQDPEVDPNGDSTISALFPDLELTGELVWLPGRVV